MPIPPEEEEEECCFYLHATGLLGAGGVKLQIARAQRPIIFEGDVFVSLDREVGQI